MIQVILVSAAGLQSGQQPVGNASVGLGRVDSRTHDGGVIKDLMLDLIFIPEANERFRMHGRHVIRFDSVLHNNFPVGRELVTPLARLLPAGRREFVADNIQGSQRF